MSRVLAAMLMVFAATPAGVPVRAQAPVSSAPRDFVVDLATLEAGQEVRVPLQLRQSVKLVLQNLLPSAEYRVRIEGADPRTVVPRMTSRRPSPAPYEQCRAMEATLSSLFSASTEAEAARLRAALDADEACRTRKSPRDPGWEGFLRTVARTSMTWRITDFYASKGGQSWRVTIDRVRSPNVAAATWTVVLAHEIPALQWRHATEEAWIVDDIAQDVVAAVASGARLPSAPDRVTVASNGPRHEIAIRGRTAAPVTLVLEPARMWSPGEMAPIVRAAMTAFAARRGPASAEGAAHAPLADLRAPVMRRVASRLTAALRQNALDPALHESAAFVTGALAWREAAGDLYDVRAGLNRMTAHLAVARALRSDGEAGSVDGQLAGAMLDVLAGRQRAAVEALMPLAAQAGPAGAWARAIVLRANGDWRAMKTRGPLALVEQLELFRALGHHVSGLVALELLDEHAPPVMDWPHVALSDAPTVQEGNVFSPVVLSSTLAEAAEVAGAVTQRTADDPQALLAAIAGASRSGGAVDRLEVLPWPTWAGFYERHLLAALLARQHHGQMLRGWLASREPEAESLLAALPLSAAVAIEVEDRALGPGSAISADPPRTEEHCRAGTELVRTRPQRVPPALWGAVSKWCSVERDSGLLPFLHAWLSPIVPRGTAYAPTSRFIATATSASTRIDLPDRFFEDVLALAPWTADLPPEWRRGPGGMPLEATAADYQRLFGEVLPYSVPALHTLARLQPLGSPERMRTLASLCELEAVNCIDLALVHQRAGRHAEMASLLERALREGRDRVAVAAGMTPLADFHLERGDAEKALEVARQVADVGSGAGLSTLGRTLQRLGRYREAEAVLEQLDTTYEEPGALRIMHIRANRPSAGSAYGDKARRAIEAIFPRGVERVALRDLSGDPADGVAVTEYSELQPAGLRAGDIIVAVDGIRVHNTDQHDAARAMSDDPVVSFIVWRDGRYLAAKGRFRDRFYRAYLAEHPPR